jgi:hypothetical protein
MINNKNKNDFFISEESDSDVEYEPGDIFDLDDEWRPIPRVIKRKYFDKNRIFNYILFFSCVSILGYLIYSFMTDLYK